MSNGNAALTLALGAGAGLALWYLLRDENAATNGDGAESDRSDVAATTPPCALRLDAKGLTADGTPIDVPGAVAKCQAAGRADLVLADDAPSSVSADLAAAFQAAGILISERRNARRRARRRRRTARRDADRRKLSTRDDRSSQTYAHFTLRTYPEGTKGGARLRHFLAGPATSWKDAYYRLIAAGLVDSRLAGKTHEPGGWMLSVDPAQYRADRAEALP